MMKRLVPKIFYDRMEQGFDLFVDGMGFDVVYKDSEFAVIERDGARAYLSQSPEFAAKDRPEIAIETDDINALYGEISARRPDLLHPNGKAVAEKPWGMLEFALLDKTGVCVIFRQPAN
jgi:hypothetical protein